eukprot:scaffold6592_cov411-Prasinococcus_capsulatus_cf.AAC.4
MRCDAPVVRWQRGRAAPERHISQRRVAHVGTGRGSLGERAEEEASPDCSSRRRPQRPCATSTAPPPTYGISCCGGIHSTCPAGKGRAGEAERARRHHLGGGGAGDVGLPAVTGADPVADGARE